ncbi:MAG TPA: polysaccharide biosynthesis/export family protein [Terriglobia bacterium]|nr:polysaccharide biosynthesis/export family protein [Terriglobia bacterium]
MSHRIFFWAGTAIILSCALALGADDGKPTVARHGTRTQAMAAADTSEPGSSLQRRNPRYQLSVGDVLDLSFPLTPEFNQMVTVQPDGYIGLLGLGDVHVQGQTVPELTQTLKAAYAKTLHDPIITIQLKEFEKPYFIAGGEVGHPGKYDLRGDTTLTEAVAIAGGFTDASKHSEVWLFRRVSREWVSTQKLNLKKMLYSGNLGEDPELQPGDMIYVPKNRLSKVRRFMPVGTLSAYFNPLSL